MKILHILLFIVNDYDDNLANNFIVKRKVCFSTEVAFPWQSKVFIYFFKFVIYSTIQVTTHTNVILFVHATILYYDIKIFFLITNVLIQFLALKRKNVNRKRDPICFNRNPLFGVFFL